MGKRRRNYAVIFGALTLFLTLFIFWNSLQSGEESGAQSDFVVDIVKKLFGFLGITVKDYNLGVFIRKTAHFSEYLVLCIATSLFIINTFSRRFSPVAPVYCGIVAVCDEFVMQMSTAGRSPQWTDVLIDVAGALTGLLILLFIIWYRNRTATRR